MLKVVLGLGAVGTVALNQNLSVLPDLVSTNDNSTDIQNFLNHHIPTNIFSATAEPPTCTLSGRVKATSHLSSVQDFINDSGAEMSIKEDEIKKVVDEIHAGDYSEIFTNQELRYLVLAGLARGELSIWEASNVLIWYQLIQDYPDSGLSIVPLLDNEGNWMPGANEGIVKKKSFLKHLI